MEQVQEISKKIVQLVRESPGETLLGVRLGALLKLSFPSFYPASYGCKNLRKFVSTHVLEVAEKGISGTSVIYGITDANAKPTAIPFSPTVGEVLPLPVPSEYWKAYSNPAYRFVIVVNRDTGEFNTYPSNLDPQAPWVAIPKQTSEFHAALAKEFVSSLSDPEHSILMNALHDPKWYIRFSLLASKFGQGGAWNNFRRAKLIEKFNAAIRDLSIPQNREFPSATRSSKQRFWPSAHPALDAAGRDEAAFRQIIYRVVSELPLSDLRSIRLPIGSVLDALKRP